MAKKNVRRAEEGAERPQSLGEFLGHIRGVKKLSLRDVEEATQKEVSNAYLSQLETGKISQPRPNILHSLAGVYGVPYEVLMTKAGYLGANSAATELRAAAPVTREHFSVLANESLTQEEEEKLLEFLAFLRWRRNRAV